MHRENVAFTRADAVFYDRGASGPANDDDRFAPATADWTGWLTTTNDEWTAWHPQGHQLPEQGWKIHVSTTLDDAVNLLRIVSGYCNQRRLAFKYLRARSVLAARNSKDAGREGSGKFITIYPAELTFLEVTLAELDALVGGRAGPYILSDLRWNDGPLYVRYGAFARIDSRDASGRPILALHTPDGDLVEDRRTVGFEPPAWVTIPPFLQSQLDLLTDTTAPDNFPYVVDRPLHYSNCGGVYAARLPSGQQVVLKEARPHTGLTAEGRDAVARLRDEESALRVLAGDDVVALRDSVPVGDHFFLALELVDGSPLNTEIVTRTPIVRANATPADYIDYRQWALHIADQVEAAIRRIHAAGYVHGDLHPANVLVTKDNRIVLVDFEAARPITADAPVILGAPGFVAPDRRRNTAADRYALACLKLTFFVPLTSLLNLDPLKAGDLINVARTTFALDEAWLDSIRQDLGLPERELLSTRSRLVHEADEAIRTWRAQSEADLVSLQVMIGRSLSASADFSRADRCWPGDPLQFDEGAFGLAHGAAGVIHTLDSCGLDVDPQGLEWLDGAVQGHGTGPGPGMVRVGLYDGLAGVGWMYRRLGDHARADAILARVRATRMEDLGSDLYGGIPGVGLYLLSEVDRDPALLTTVIAMAQMLRARHDQRPNLRSATPVVATGHGGLMWGPSGTALFAARLHQHTGDPAHLGLALDALNYDLGCCAQAPDGSLQMNEGWRLMPYLATGSTGIGLVACELLPLVDCPEPYLAAVAKIRLAACSPFAIQPSLFHGRAGLIDFLVTLSRSGLATAQSEQALDDHVAALRAHAVRHRTGIGFPGEGLLRLSCDLATGSAGVLGALHSFELLRHHPGADGWDALLPLLLPPHASVLPSAPPTLA